MENFTDTFNKTEKCYYEINCHFSSRMKVLARKMLLSLMENVIHKTVHATEFITCFYQDFIFSYIWVTIFVIILICVQYLGDLKSFWLLKRRISYIRNCQCFKLNTLITFRNSPSLLKMNVNSHPSKQVYYIFWLYILYFSWGKPNYKLPCISWTHPIETSLHNYRKKTISIKMF